MNTRKSTIEEINTLEHIVLMSTHPWNPKDINDYDSIAYDTDNGILLLMIRHDESDNDSSFGFDIKEDAFFGIDNKMKDSTDNIELNIDNLYNDNVFGEWNRAFYGEIKIFIRI